MPAEVRPPLAQMKVRMEARPQAALGSWAGFRNGSLHGQAGRCCASGLCFWSWRSAKSELLAGDLLLHNFYVDSWLATSCPATVNSLLCSTLGVTVWLENVLPSFYPKEQWETCRVLLVQNFSPILSVIPEATPLSVLVGLHWLRMQ